MTPLKLSYALLKVPKLLSETFFLKMHCSRNIWSDWLKWDILYNPFPFFFSCRSLWMFWIPQEFILRLLLFNIFVSDLSNISLYYIFLRANALYANDVIFLKSFHPFDALTICSTLNTDVKSIAEWSTDNALYLNPSKTSFLIVASSTLLSGI